MMLLVWVLPNLNWVCVLWACCDNGATEATGYVIKSISSAINPGTHNFQQPILTNGTNIGLYAQVKCLTCSSPPEHFTLIRGLPPSPGHTPVPFCPAQTRPTNGSVILSQSSRSTRFNWASSIVLACGPRGDALPQPMTARQSPFTGGESMGASLTGATFDGVASFSNATSNGSKLRWSKPRNIGCGMVSSTVIT